MNVRELNILIAGSFIGEKALNFDKNLGDENFNGSEG